MNRPIVAVTCDRRALGPAPVSPNVRPPRAEVFVGEAVVERLRAAGASVVLLPPGDAEGALAVLARVDALVITGGAFDIHPRHYGQAVTARLDRTDEDRTTLELAVARAAMANDVPTLGLCGGMQVLAVAAGGTLLQHVDGHEQPTDPAGPGHLLVPEPGAPGWLVHALGPDTNSTHHQAVGEAAAFRVAARAPDGVVEAIWRPDRRFCVGVQGHPEQRSSLLFAALVAACAPPRAPGG